MNELEKELLEDQAEEEKAQAEVEKEKMIAVSIYQLMNIGGDGWHVLIGLISERAESAKQMCVESFEHEADTARGGYMWLKELLNMIDHNIEKGREIVDEKANRPDQSKEN